MPRFKLSEVPNGYHRFLVPHPHEAVVMCTASTPSCVLTWRHALEEALKAHLDEVAPYEIPPAAYDALEAVITMRLRRFSFM